MTILKVIQEEAVDPKRNMRSNDPEPQMRKAQDHPTLGILKPSKVLSSPIKTHLMPIPICTTIHQRIVAVYSNHVNLRSVRTQLKSQGVHRKIGS